MYFTWFASVHSLSQFLSLWWVWFISNIVFDEFIDFHILKFVFLSKLLRVISFPAAWGSHQQHARWPPGSLRSCQFQDAHDFFKNNTLRSVSIELNNLSFACWLHAFNLSKYDKSNSPYSLYSVSALTENCSMSSSWNWMISSSLLRFLLTLSIEMFSAISRRMNLSGTTLIFCRAIACRRVRGNPSIIQLVDPWPSFSNYSIYIFTNSITISSLT